MSYPDRATLVSASDVDELTSLDGPVQDGLRLAAITTIEAAAGQSFEQEGDSGSGGELVTKHIDGNGSDRVGLPKRLATLTDLTIVGSSLTIDEVVVTDTRDRIAIRGPNVGNWLERQLAEPTVGVTFPDKPGAVEVTGIWGWLDEEYERECDAITVALRFQMEDDAIAQASAIGDSARAYRNLGLNAISQGNLSAQAAEQVPTVTPRVRRLLRGRTPGGFPLVWRPAIGAVA